MTERRKIKTNGIALTVLGLIGIVLLLWPTSVTYDEAGSGSENPRPVKLRCVWDRYEPTDTTPVVRTYERRAYVGDRNKVSDSISDDRIRADCALATLEKRQWIFLPTLLLSIGLVLCLAPIGRVERRE
ncbi:hypothetical protein ACIA03_06360 [Nocardioides sp. NPDC051685]|uniref:hypothetical protein n=1 Tax=Nocardioides sp. NPDC051685 TaxID=3364334 RepID=UPI0037B1060A